MLALNLTPDADGEVFVDAASLSSNHPVRTVCALNKATWSICNHLVRGTEEKEREQEQEMVHIRLFPGVEPGKSLACRSSAPFR